MNIALYVLGACVGILFASQIPHNTPARDERRAKTDVSRIKLFMQIIVTLAILAVSLFVILTNAADAQNKHWAYGAVGTILGFWLRSSK